MGDVTKIFPWTHLLISSRRADVKDPSPTFLHCIPWFINLKEPLGTALIVYDYPVRFSESSRRNNKVCLLRGGRVGVVQGNYSFTGFQKIIYFRSLTVLIEIIL